MLYKQIVPKNMEFSDKYKAYMGENHKNILIHKPLILYSMKQETLKESNIF